MELEFEWDEEKSTINERKHGVTFQSAQTVFGDPLATIFADEEHSQQEERQLIVGLTDHGELLFVSFVERSENLMRIISARRPTKRERREYEEAH
jgi:uncharacterized protein